MFIPKSGMDLLSWLMGSPFANSALADSALTTQTAGPGNMTMFNSTAAANMSLNCNRLMNGDRSYCAQAVGRFDPYHIYSTRTAFVGRVNWNFNESSTDPSAGCMVTLDGNFMGGGGVNGTVVWEMISQLYNTQEMGVCGSATFSNGFNVTLDMCEGKLNCKDFNPGTMTGAPNNALAANYIKTPVTGSGPAAGAPSGPDPGACGGPDDDPGDIDLTLMDMGPGPVEPPSNMEANPLMALVDPRPDHPGPNWPPTGRDHARNGWKKPAKCYQWTKDPTDPDCLDAPPINSAAPGYIPPPPLQSPPNSMSMPPPSGYQPPPPPPLPVPPPASTTGFPSYSAPGMTPSNSVSGSPPVQSTTATSTSAPTSYPTQA